MSSFTGSNLFGIRVNQANISIQRYFKGYVPKSFNGGTFPVLALPQDFSSYIFSKASVKLSNKDILIPEIDKILTDYCNECLQTYFTIEFVELVNQQAFSSNFSIKDEKLEYAVSLYIMICKLPLHTNDSEIRKTLSFYLSNPFQLFLFSSQVSQTNLTNLKKTLEPTEKRYLDNILKVYLPNQKPPSKINNENAKWFINKANSEMEADLNYYFETAKMRATLFNAESIINDPRFRPSLKDPAWNDYDETIKTEVAYYNQKFSGTNGFIPLDWRVVKAMVWTEVLAGPKGNPTQWQKYPLQIGRFSADLGYSTVKSGGENSDLVISSELRKQISSDVTGKNNVKAGIAYLYTIAIRNKIVRREVIDDSQIESYAVQKTDRDGLAGIAKRLGTTSENIVKNSGVVNPAKLVIGQDLLYQKAHYDRFINGWSDWTETVKNYNGGGDGNYLEKFNRAYQIIISRTSK